MSFLINLYIIKLKINRIKKRISLTEMEDIIVSYNHVVSNALQ